MKTVSPRSAPAKAKAAFPLVRKSKVARWGNSLAFRIPQEVADRLKLADGGQVSLEVGDESFTVRPVRKKWTEAELLRGVTPKMVGGEVDWGGAVGKEV
jgi:antitoxin MazE